MASKTSFSWLCEADKGVYCLDCSLFMRPTSIWCFLTCYLKPFRSFSLIDDFSLKRFGQIHLQRMYLFMLSLLFVSHCNLSLALLKWLDVLTYFHILTVQFTYARYTETLRYVRTAFNLSPNVEKYRWCSCSIKWTLFSIYLCSNNIVSPCNQTSNSYNLIK